MDFIYKYFIYPINARIGYNIVNTTVYASIAIIALYLIYLWWKKEGIKLNKQFLVGLISFVLFGATKRVVTDAVDNNILSGGIYVLYKYNIWNVSPMIYVYTGLLFVLFYYIEYKKHLPYLSSLVGGALFIFHFLLLLPAIKYLDALLFALVLALLPSTIYLYFKKDLGALVIFSQGLDGAATFYGVDFLGYGEQHVLSSFIGDNFGYVWFYLLKVLIAVLFVLAVNKEVDDKNEKLLFFSAAIVLGLAPGTRDILRMIIRT